jgi:hypothetical protein
LDKLFDNDLLFKLPETKSEYFEVNGNADKGLFILAYKTDLHADNISKLNQILSAIKYDPKEDIATVYIADDHPFSLAELLNKHTCSEVLIFGLHPKMIGLNIYAKRYQWIHLENTTILFADKLEVLKDNKDMKNQLWLSLKSRFLK